MVDGPNFQSGRVPCPKYKRKGVGYAPHPHAFGYKDYDRAHCRYCNATFRIKQREAVQSGAVQE